MGQSLTEIAQTLKNADKKVQLIYAFNGTGKTRLSRELKDLIAPKNADIDEENDIKILYYNAFTEDLFYWDNDLDNDVDRKMKIQPNKYTGWALKEQGQEPNITAHFQRYTSDKLTPRFNEQYIIKDKENNDLIIPAYSEVRFSFERGNDEPSEFIKISKGEESSFIWCVFYSLLEQAIDVLSVAEEGERETNLFNDLQYVFVDDPVSSLDDNHLIELAVNLAQLVKRSPWDSVKKVKYIITTHNPLFYNVLFNEFNNSDIRLGYKVKHGTKGRLEKLEDGTYLLDGSNDSPFSYHLFLLNELEKVILSGEIQKFHFNFLRNILEKSSTFLGYKKWEELLPNEVVGEREGYIKRILNFSSHSKYSGEEVSLILDSEKEMLKSIVKIIKSRHGFNEISNSSETENNDAI